jgi:uncharacterized protein
VEESLTIAVREGVTVTALRTLPDARRSDIVVAYAPGAGSNLHDPFGACLARFLDERGFESWRFQFPYSEKGRKAPDPAALLEATWEAVIETARRPEPPGAAVRRLVIGGRSMGGRIASVVAAKGAPVAGLALFAYPLVPPGRTESDRADHFASITAPALFCSGTRDAFATPDQLCKEAARIPGATVHVLEGADHGFAVLKSSGRTREDVWREASEALLGFLESIG